MVAPLLLGWQGEVFARDVTLGAATHGRGKQKPIWCYDLHATILHLLGVDHTQLTYPHNGLERRLTDVHGHVLKEILS